MIKAILFDLDGTLVDSEPLHYSSHAHALSHAKIKLSESDYIGRGMNRSSRLFYAEMATLNGRDIDYSQLHAHKQSHFNENMHTIKLFPRLKEIITNLKDNYLLGIVTAAPTSYAQQVLNINGVAGLFNVIIGSNDYQKNKPEPDPYLLACKRLGVAPSECIA